MYVIRQEIRQMLLLSVTFLLTHMFLWKKVCSLSFLLSYQFEQNSVPKFGEKYVIGMLSYTMLQKFEMIY